MTEIIKAPAAEVAVANDVADTTDVAETTLSCAITRGIVGRKAGTRKQVRRGQADYFDTPIGPVSRGGLEMFDMLNAISGDVNDKAIAVFARVHFNFERAAALKDPDSVSEVGGFDVLKAGKVDPVGNLKANYRVWVAGALRFENAA